MKKIIIEDELFDELVERLGWDGISDEDIGEALERMRGVGEEIPNGELIEAYQEENSFVVWVED